MAMQGDSVLELFAASLRAETEQELLRCPADSHGVRFDEMLRQRDGSLATHDESMASPGASVPTLSLSGGQGAELPLLSLADPALAQFCSDLRASTELALEASKPAKTKLARRRKRRSPWAPVAAFAAAAAMAMILIEVPGVAQLGQSLQGQVASLASWNKEQASEPDGVATSRRNRASKGDRSLDPVVPAQALAVGADEASLEEDLVPDTGPAEVVSVEHMDVPVPKKPSDASLMRQAHALWKKGKNKRAQRLFRRVAYRSSNRDSAQAAFADLFSIGRQLGGRSVLKREWTRYLKKFPKGRYAQDAQAGLCSMSENDAGGRACWSIYLQRFPKGVYARKAKKILGSNP